MINDLNPNNKILAFHSSHSGLDKYVCQSGFAQGVASIFGLAVAREGDTLSVVASSNAAVNILKGYFAMTAAKLP